MNGMMELSRLRRRLFLRGSKILGTADSKYSEEFLETLERARLVQECRLVELAVFRKGDPGFIKFILQNKAGW